MVNLKDQKKDKQRNVEGIKSESSGNSPASKAIGPSQSTTKITPSPPTQHNLRDNLFEEKKGMEVVVIQHENRLMLFWI